MTVEQARKEIEYMIKGIKNDVSNFENNNKLSRVDLTLAIVVLKPKITLLESILTALEH